MIDIHWTEVDGVKTIWVDAPEPLRAVLMFRSGRADETATTAGQNHLIEHLVLSEINDHHNSNGAVDDVVTLFTTMGRPEDVTAFLSKVCRGLTSLQAERLESEKKILLAEAATRRHDICSDLLIWRFGARGHGLRGMPEYGTRGATLEQLEKWIAQRFTRGNAILYLSGPLPEGLRLELPPGEKQPLPPLVAVQPEFPGWYVNDMCGGCAAGTLVPRVSAATIFNVIADTRLRERLRNESAVSYNPSIFYDPLTADTAHLVLYADSDAKRRPELVEAFGKVFTGLTEIESGELETAKKQYLDHTTGPLAPPLAERTVYEAHHAAISWLYGQEYESLEQIAAEAATVSLDDIHAFSRDMQHTALIALPGGSKLEPWMGKKALVSTAPVVKGKEVPNIDAPIRRERLIYGPEGVSIRLPDGTDVTVRYAELAAALYYEDGCIGLIGCDATHLFVEPTLWRNGPAICREIHKRIPVDLLLDQGSRAADAIPKPKTTAWQRLVATLKGQGGK